MTLRIVPGPEPYQDVWQIKHVECGHESIRDVRQLHVAGWVHACPGCPEICPVPKPSDDEIASALDRAAEEDEHVAALRRARR